MVNNRGVFVFQISGTQRIPYFVFKSSVGPDRPATPDLLSLGMSYVYDWYPGLRMFIFTHKYLEPYLCFRVDITQCNESYLMGMTCSESSKDSRSL